MEREDKRRREVEVGEDVASGADKSQHKSRISPASWPLDPEQPAPPSSHSRSHSPLNAVLVLEPTVGESSFIVQREPMIGIVS